MTDAPGDAVAPDVFEEHRALLFTVAYEMLSSAADAEDVVQESWLRWSAVDRAAVRDPRAYLVRIVTRQALNRLRTLQRRRETYVGPWLPEPLVTAPDVLDDIELADSVSFAMLVVLDTLSPLERAVFVLREVFGFDYHEIARTLDRSAAAVRQLASRARAHVEERRPRAERPDDVESIIAEFFLATTTGQVDRLLEMLAPDVVLHSDGGGKRKAALRPIHGADKVIRFLVAVTPHDAEIRVDTAIVNGAPAFVMWLDDELDSVVTGTVADGRITELFFVRNPDKLTGIDVVRTVGR